MGLIDAVLLRLFPPQPEPLASVRERLGRPVVARGRVVPRDLLTSPISGARCVYYRYLVEEWGASTGMMLGGGGMWMCIDRDEAIAEFYLDDGTERVLVLPEHAQIIGGRARPVPMPRGQRAHEVVIMPGDLVEVHGVADETADLLGEDRGYRERVVRTLVRAGEGDALRLRLL